MGLKNGLLVRQLWMFGYRPDSVDWADLFQCLTAAQLACQAEAPLWSEVMFIQVMFTQPQPCTPCRYVQSTQRCSQEGTGILNVPRHPAAGGESLGEKHSGKWHKFECPKLLAIYEVFGVYSEGLAWLPFRKCLRGCHFKAYPWRVTSLLSGKGCCRRKGSRAWGTCSVHSSI